MAPGLPRTDRPRPSGTDRRGAHAPPGGADLPLDHLDRLTDARGVASAARGAVPRFDAGYLTIDVAGALRVVARAGGGPRARALRRTYVDHLLGAQEGPEFRGRRNRDGSWPILVGDDRVTGRVLWALGGAIASGDDDVHDDCRRLFEDAAAFHAVDGRANALAVIGASDVLTVLPQDAAAQVVVRRLAHRLARPRPDRSWPWPEARLGRVNGVLPEALLAAGGALGDVSLVGSGLGLLRWLVGISVTDLHLSLAPVDGWGLDEPRARFDQSPGEVAALVSACARAWALTGDPSWRDVIERGVVWFAGENDAGRAMADFDSGVCHDRLRSGGPSRNQGPEATIDLLTVLHAARAVGLPAPTRADRGREEHPAGSGDEVPASPSHSRRPDLRLVS